MLCPLTACLRLFSLAILLCTALSAMAAKTPVILSTDVGNEIDDQWAITYLLTQPGFDVLGIASAHAPSLPEPAAHNTYKVLREVVEQRLGLTVHPPLLEGSSLPLANGTTPQRSAAASFIVEQSRLFSSEHRLNVLVIGAATDMASALLIDPTVADRVRVVAMAFKNLQPEGAHEYNEQNDPEAWRLLLASRTPIVVGTGDVCTQFLSLTYEQAHTLLQNHGPVAAWLWEDYQRWYYSNVKPLRVADFSKSWVIWDIITLAYLRGLATAEAVPRPELDQRMNFVRPAKEAFPGTFASIQHVDSAKLWAEFLSGLDQFEATHRVPESYSTP